jgi:hypothetical protein
MTRIVGLPYGQAMLVTQDPLPKWSALRASAINLRIVP